MFSQKAAPAQPVLPALQHTVSGCQTLHADSRKIQPNDVFIACQGEYADGRDYIADAIANGASFVYWDDDGAFKWQPEWQVPNQAISDLKQRAGMLAAQAYDNLSGSLKIIGVTGTNGKTSITQWLAQAIDDLEHTPSCAIIGTVGNGFFGALQETTHTTPDPVAVQTLIHQFKQQGARSIAMEVSSHGLAQYRVNGVPFHTAVFTNLTRDHLDYHGSMAEYGAAKERLFYWQGLQNAIINSDDAFGAALAAELKQHSGSLKTEGCNEVKTYTYGFNEQADIRITQFAASTQGMSISLATPWGEGSAQTRLLGRFNAQNFAAALGAPDALEKALTTLREIRQPESRLWCVFGCGGDRDRGKRPLMGAVASQFADRVVVTSDNPRTESPQAIINDILPAVPHPALVEADRKAAIEQTIAQAQAQDIVLIAGKGHETYQDVQGVKHHFSDFEVAQDALGQW